MGAAQRGPVQRGPVQRGPVGGCHWQWTGVVPLSTRAVTGRARPSQRPLRLPWLARGAMRAGTGFRRPHWQCGDLAVTLACFNGA
jgi:hypothetical protein